MWDLKTAKSGDGGVVGACASKFGYGDSFCTLNCELSPYKARRCW